MTTELNNAAPYVFLSYASADRDRALHITNLLEHHGIAVWIDRKSIAGGTSWSAEIVRGIEECAILAVLCSASAMASPNVQQELQLAWEYRRTVLPLRLDTAPPPRSVEYVLTGRQWIDVLDRPDEVWLPEALRALPLLGLGTPSNAAALAPSLSDQSQFVQTADLNASTNSSSAPSTSAGNETILPPRNYLPVPVTSFVGRERELAEVKSILQTTRLVTLTGAGGCGKTRLALRGAADLLQEYPHGVWFIDLSPLADAGIVAQAVLTTLGLHVVPDRAPVEQLVAYLRPRRSLLVLDNCEHLVASCAWLVDALLQACPQLQVLATSREPLGVAGEKAWRVPSLALPEGGTNPADLARYGSIQLFTERARQVRPGFAVSEGNAAAVAQICRRLDGIPLAIELAAALLRGLAVEQIAARLGDRFDLLIGGIRTAPGRHQTLRAMVDWSHDLLSPSERSAFRRLAVFAGGWTLEAAESVCADEGFEARDFFGLLLQLVDKSLVIVDEGEHHVRYRLLETIRQYATEKLVQSGEVESVRRRHYDWFLALAEKAEPNLYRGDQVAWLDRLAEEHDNLRAALTWSQAEPERTEEGLRLAGALWWFWFQRGFFTEGRRWLGGLLAADGNVRASVRAKALVATGLMAEHQGDRAQAVALAESSLALSRSVGDRWGIAMSLSCLGVTARSQGHYERAAALKNETLVLFREIGDTFGIVWSLRDLGSLALQRGDLAAAEDLLAESVTLAQSVGDKLSVARGLEYLGGVFLARGAPDRATQVLDESVALCRALGYGDGLCRSLERLARVKFAQGQSDQAKQLLAESLKMRWELGEREGVAACLEGLARLAGQGGESGRAARLLGAAARVRQAVDTFVPQADLADTDQIRDAAHSALGDAAFAEAWAEGQAMTLERAISFALGETGD